MKLPFGATKEDFERCKKILSKLVNDKIDFNELTLTIMNISYSTGGNYSDEIILKYAMSYLKNKKEVDKIQSVGNSDKFAPKEIKKK